MSRTPTSPSLASLLREASGQRGQALGSPGVAPRDYDLVPVQQLTNKILFNHTNSQYLDKYSRLAEMKLLRASGALEHVKEGRPLQCWGVQNTILLEM